MAVIPFISFIQEGSNYEIGLERGRFIRNDPDASAFFANPPQGFEPLTDAEAERRLALLEHACPGMRDEINGFADGLGVDVKSQVLLYCTIKSKAPRVEDAPRACGVVAVPGSLTTNGHVCVARSYEYNYDDETIYSVTRVPGKYAHVGFSLMHMGRFDGMNEKGLCAAIASCENVRSSAGLAEGVPFFVIVRRILDECATVSEALELMRMLPVADNFNYIFADPSGDVCKVETLCLDTGVSRAELRGGLQFAFNHYAAPQHRALKLERKRFSVMREERVERLFAENDKVSPDALFALLNTPLPEGLCSSAYDDWFGTLHSMFFDLTEKKLRVCFGSPERGTWFEADPNAKPGCEVTMVDCPSVAVPGSYWEKC